MNFSHSWNYWNVPGDENKDFFFCPAVDTPDNLGVYLAIAMSERTKD